MLEIVKRFRPRTETCANIDVLIGVDPTKAIDEFLDAGGSFIYMDVRPFPREWIADAAKHTRRFFQKPYNTELRAAELGVSRECERHHFSPSWNADLFPETPVLAAAQPLRRANETKAQRRARCKAKAQTAQSTQGQQGQGPGVRGQGSGTVTGLHA